MTLSEPDEADFGVEGLEVVVYPERYMYRRVNREKDKIGAGFSGTSSIGTMRRNVPSAEMSALRKLY